MPRNGPSGEPIPDDPTEAQIREIAGMTYTPEGVEIAMSRPHRDLDGKAPVDLLDTAEGRRRVYGRFLAAAEGTFT